VKRLSEEIDVSTVSSENRQKQVTLHIREFPGTEPAVVEVLPDWTVQHVEQKYARAKGKNPGSCRFSVNGQVLQQNMPIGSLPSAILNGTQVIDASPEHGVGAK
jgi:hypothetical protein